MTLDRALLSLLENIESSDKPVLISWDDVQPWGQGVLDKLVEFGLLAISSPAQILECNGCEHRCFMDVITDTGNGKQSRVFIVCDVPEKQSEMGRIQISGERLKQWQCSIKQLARVVQDLLAMTNDIASSKGAIRLGMLQGKGGRRWVSLLNHPLVLEINEFKTPVNELLFVDDGVLVIDMPRIDELVDTKPASVGKIYAPSTDLREEKKLKTQAKYQDWQDAYQVLKIKYPAQSKVWISRKISRMPIAQGSDAETIRKHLK